MNEHIIGIIPYPTRRIRAVLAQYFDTHAFLIIQFDNTCNLMRKLSKKLAIKAVA
jgi:hypothetical protein